MDTNNIETYVNLMTECFKDDPGIKAQLKGIENAEDVLRRQYRCQLEPFFKLDCVTTYGDGEGMAMGYFTEEAFMERFAESMQASATGLLENISIDDLTKMQENAAAVIEVAQPDWHKKYMGEKEVYVLQVIMVREASRGTGVFRKLMAPILEKAERKGVPVVLQTFEFGHVAKYERFGFKLMEKAASDKTDLVCYNLMRDA